MFEYIDKYCERLSPDLWGEPLNIISNLTYLLAGILLLRLYQSSLNETTRRDWDIEGLILLLILIAMGSGLWHVYAQKWSLFADVIPILLFINLYILSCLVRILRCSIMATVGIFLFYHALNFSLQNLFDKDFLNGSIFYLPTWLFLMGIGLMLMRSNKDVSKQYLWVSGVFALALFFRSIDLGVCDTMMSGTHFLWHILTAYMMFKLVSILIKPSSTNTAFR